MFSQCLRPRKRPDCPSLIPQSLDTSRRHRLPSRTPPRRMQPPPCLPGDKLQHKQGGWRTASGLAKRLNFQTIRVTWVIFLKTYELWVKFRRARELWVKFQNFSSKSDQQARCQSQTEQLGFLLSPHCDRHRTPLQHQLVCGGAANFAPFSIPLTPSSFTISRGGHATRC